MLSSQPHIAQCDYLSLQPRRRTTSEKQPHGMLIKACHQMDPTPESVLEGAWVV